MIRAISGGAKARGLLSALALAIASPLLSQTVQDAAGLAIPMESSFTSTRDAALASALAPTAGEGTGFLGNPAGLGDLRLGEFSIAHRVWMADTSVTGILAVFPHDQELGGLGLSFHRTSYGLFEGRDATGAPAPDPSADQWSFAAAWGKDWGGGFCVGVALRASNQDLAGVAYRALLADAGLVAKLDRDWKVGLSLVDLGLALDQGSPPTVLRLGTSYGLDLAADLRLLLAAAGTVEHGAISRVLTGAEAFFLDRIFLRAGYRLVLPDDRSGGGSGPTVGAGYSWKEFRLDYAFLPMGDLGSGHQVGLSYFLPEGPSRPVSTQVPSPTPTASSTPTSSASATASRTSTSMNTQTGTFTATPSAPPARASIAAPTATPVYPGATPSPRPTLSISIEVEEEDAPEGTPTAVPGTIGK